MKTCCSGFLYIYIHLLENTSYGKCDLISLQFVEIFRKRSVENLIIQRALPTEAEKEQCRNILQIRKNI